jgi:multidrug efflux system membrane fusion protein
VDAILRAALSNAAWSVVLALAAAVGARAWRRRPAVSHALWLLVLLKLITPSLTEFPFPSRAGPPEAAPAPVIPITASRRSAGREVVAIPPREPIAPAPAAEALLHPATRRDAPPPAESVAAAWGVAVWPWRAAIAAIWLGGTAAFWSVVGLATVRFRRLTASAHPATEGLSRRLAALAGRMSLRSIPEARLVPARVPPMLWVPQFGRARLLLPEGLWDRLDPIQQDAILAHELTHLERGDHWVRRLEALSLGLYWWDPAAWWARRRLEQAEEECCDARVVSLLPAAAGAYAETLVATAVYLSGAVWPMPMGASGVGRLDPIKRRLHMILSDAVPAPSASRTARAFVLAAMLSLPLLPTAATGGPSVGPSRGPEPPAAPQREPDGDRKADRPQAAPAPADGKVRIKATRPVRREVRDYAYFAGQVDAAMTVSLRPRVSGMIVNVFCQPGQTVKRGDVLFQIDPRSYQAELDKARAEVQVARNRLEIKRASARYTARLAERNTVSRDEADQVQREARVAEASVEAAEKARELAQLNLDFTRLESPIQGLIVGPVMTAGNIGVADNTTLATIVSTNPIYVYFNVPENIVLKLNRQRIEGKLQLGPGKGLPVEVGLQDESHFRRRGIVDSLNGAMDPRTGTARWRAKLTNPDDLLLPGLSANVRIPVGEPRQALLVPAEATWMEKGVPHVAVVSDDGRLESRQVTTLSDHGGMREVKDGLKGNEWILKGNEWVVEFRQDVLQALQNGTKVDVERVPPPDGASSGSPHPR